MEEFMIIYLLLAFNFMLITSQDTDDFNFEDFDHFSDNIIKEDKVKVTKGRNNWINVIEGNSDSSGDFELGLRNAEGSGILYWDPELCGDEYEDISSGNHHQGKMKCEDSPGSIFCDDGSTCLLKEFICDGLFDCNDYFDEFFCDNNSECLPGKWRCLDGKCIDASERCNGFNACLDWSDEMYCEEIICPTGTFKCSNGICIPESLRCDRYSNCVDDSDERNCLYHDTSCQPGTFMCSNGICIPERLRCDRYSDCRDGSDERNCIFQDIICSMPGMFMCSNGICISESLRCDGQSNCRDGSDERNCTYQDPIRATTTFKCGNGICIPKNLRCDGHSHCGDRSDEQYCTFQDFEPDIGSAEGSGRGLDWEATDWTADEYDEQYSYNIGERKCVSSPGSIFCDDSTTCIMNELRCDGVIHCDDYFDEFFCKHKSECLPGQWRCLDGNCVDASERCNGFYACLDWSDEMYCEDTKCPPGTIMCANGICIPKTLRCNRHSDCRDGSDERYCRYQDVEIGMESAEGSGILDWDKEGGDDEYGNSYSEIHHEGEGKCENSPGSIFCDNGGTCLTKELMCDGVIHCDDYFDEFFCDHKTECLPDKWRCLDGNCVNILERCNGFYACPDGSDELYCKAFVCPTGTFKCADGICIPESLRCDRHSYCRDGSDELNCTYQDCSSTEYQCSDGTCLSMEKRCNGYYDCPDYSEEENCREYSCLPGRFQCDDGICIPERLRCDGHNYCRDASDEWNCLQIPSPRPSSWTPFADYVYLFASPLNQTVHEGQEVVFRCRDESQNRSPVKWIRKDGRQIDYSRSTDINGRLTIRNATLSDSGVFICKAKGNYKNTNGLEIPVILYVQSYSHQYPSIKCPTSYSTCSNGQCIPSRSVCNGYSDCTDGSDEDRCSTKCEPDEFRCRNSKCISFSWVCDSQDDCGDHSDENGCHEWGTAPVCHRDEYACASKDQCVPKYMLCDNSVDCLDGSDEFGCSKPVILESPACYKQISIGGKFSLVCTAKAKPTPIIVWRFNWGYLPSTCSFKSEYGQGVLTCTDVGPAHQGAYSCEAINYLGISFGNDAYVILETDNDALNALKGLCY